MPHGQDVESDTDGLASQYECLQCGNRIVSDSSPGECTECGGGLQNHAKSLE